MARRKKTSVMSVDAYSGLPFQAGQAVAASVGRAAVWAFSVYMRAPLRNTATVALVTLSAMAGSNALYSQTERHPAPMFGTFSDAPTKAAKAREVPQPMPVVAMESTRNEHPAAAATVAAPVAQAASVEVAPKVSNEDVRAIQEKLAAFGFYDGKADGLFGPRTSKSIRAFEEQSGRRPTGQLTAEIVSLIKSAQQPGAQASTPTSTAATAAVAPPALTVEQVTPAAETTAAIATPAAAPETALPPPAPLVSAPQEATAAAAGTAPVKRTVQTLEITAPAQNSTQPQQATAAPVNAATDPDIVKSVQRGLSSLGFLRTEINGVADEATARAIRNFEVYYNYAVSGRVTQELVNLLVQNGALI
jgi:peptidoglycan hydrolase-like protein with peptidoglycan-binding domain